MIIQLDTESHDPAVQDALFAFATSLLLCENDTLASQILAELSKLEPRALVYVMDDEGESQEFGPFSQTALNTLSEHLLNQEVQYCVKVDE